MATKEERYAEAYRRGILPADKKSRYEEAVRRGLMKNPSLLAQLTGGEQDNGNDLPAEPPLNSQQEEAKKLVQSTYGDVGSGIGRGLLEIAENAANTYLSANASLNKIIGAGSGEYQPVSLKKIADEVFPETGSMAQTLGETGAKVGLAATGWGEGAELAAGATSLLPDLNALLGASKAGRFVAGQVPKIIEAAGGSAGAQLAAGNAPSAATTAGDVALDRLTHGIFGAVRGSMNGVRNFIGRPSEQVLKAAERIGIKPSFAVASGGKGAQMVEDILTKTPGGAGIIKRHYEQEFKSIDDFIERMQQRHGTQGDSTQLGQDVINGLNSFTRQFTDKSEKLYDKLWAAIPKNTNIQVPAFIKKLEEITNRYSNDPELAAILNDPTMVRMLEAVKSKSGASIDSIKALRTRIGASIDRPELLSRNVDDADRHALYSSLTDDLEGAANAAGPQAKKAWKNANNFWAAGRSRIDNFLNPLARLQTADSVYKNLFGAEGKAAKAIDPGRAAALMKSLPVDVQGKVVSEVIQRMGEARAGAQGAEGMEFSPATFLTNWNKLPEGSKKTLFSNPETRADMDALAKYTEAFKDLSKSRNVSQTGQYITLTALLTHAAGSPATGIPALAGTVAGSTLTAKMMSSPKFINWMRKTADSQGKEELTKNIGKLVALYWNHPHLQDDISKYADGQSED